VLAAPKDGAELEAMLEQAVAGDRVWAIRFPRSSVPAAKWPTSPRVSLGQGELLRDGRQAALVAYGSMVAPAWEAAERLAAKGMDVAVVNARFAKPVDAALLAGLASRIPLLVTLEEHSAQGGFGSAVLEALAAQGASGCQVDVVGVPDRFVEHGSRAALLEGLGLTARGIADHVEELLRRGAASWARGGTASFVERPGWVSR
jgi:1-deoxy-D-xylulose-5-phosphate synthase